MRSLLIGIWVPVCLAVCCGAHAEEPGALLERIRIHVAENLSRLPDYTCHETIERVHRRVASSRNQALDKVRLEVALVGGRELYGWPGDKTIAEPDITNLVTDGAIGNGSYALFAKSIFLTGAATFVERAEENAAGVRCYRFDYRVPLERSGYRLRVGTREALVGYHGSVWLDDKTLDLMRLGVVADNIPEELLLQSSEQSVEYGRAKIGGSEFLLPRTAEMSLTGVTGSVNLNRTRFNACRQYTGESVVSFGDPPPQDTLAPAAPTPVAEVKLPEQFEADVALETLIDEHSAVGDTVHLKLLNRVKVHGKTVLPKAATLLARITRMHHDGRAWHVGFTFTDAEFAGGHADLTGRETHVFASAVLPEAGYGPSFHGLQRELMEPRDAEADGLMLASGTLRIRPGFRMMLRSHLRHRAAR